MKLKEFFGIIICGLLFIILAPASQAATVELSQPGCETSYFYPRTFDNLVLAFSITLDQVETLETVVVNNEGTAGFNEITKVVLYADSGNQQFEGFMIDQKLAEASYFSAGQWVFTDLSYSVPVGGQDFFVAVETDKSGTDNRSFIFTIPAYYDATANGQYDLGDAGLFFSTTSGLPASKLTSNCISTYELTTTDVSYPVSVITNLSQIQQISSDSFLIQGQVKDQGGSSPEWVKVWINGVAYDANITGFDDSGLYSWNYQWNNISVGVYSIRVESSDWNYNSGFSKLTYNITRTEATPEVPVTPEIDFTKSTFSNDRDEVTADGRDFVILGYEALDTNSEPVAGATVEIKTEQTWPIFDNKSGVTDADGKIYFIVKSTTAGEAVFVPWVNGEARPSSATVDFVSQPTPGNFDFSQGQLVKSPSRSSVYFIDNTNTKHVFPTQKVYASYFGNDFSAVKVWSDTELQEYALGSNVTFKEGTLFKIPEVSKVYKVEKFDNMRWIEDEPTAKALYGETWASLVYDLSEIFIDDYTEVESLKL